MRLPDRLHCPDCKGRLASTSADDLHCTGCGRNIPVIDGIADFVADQRPLGAGKDRYHDHANAASAELFSRIVAAAADRWPDFLGDTMQFGCGNGDVSQAIVSGQSFRSLLVIDTELEALQTCRSRLTPRSDQPVGYAAIHGGQDVIRDAVADTVFGTGLLSGIAEVRGFLAMIHRILRPNGRAAFVVPNRRYREAMCLAIAQALVQRRGREGAWPEGQEPVLEMIAQTRRLLVHRGNPGLLSALTEKHLFDSEALEDLGHEVGFTTAEVIPLEPDPAGAETIHRHCREAGAADVFTDQFGALAASVGRPFFDLLSRQDGSAAMLVWLSKAQGPRVRIFSHRPAPAVVKFSGPDAALGGAAPRWSVELSARATADGIVVSLGGWCLCNTDILWLRLTLDGVVGYAPVWRPRPDVHDVLNRGGQYQPLNALCSGLDCEILFKGAHATDNACSFRLEVLLANGLVVTGPAPEMLIMDEQMVIAH